MRKIFKIFFVFLLVAGIVIVDLPFILSFFSLDTHLKDYLISTINAQNEKIVSIENVKISFWKIELKDIKIVSSTASSQFILKNAQLNYNIWKLITEPSAPENSITDVVFVEPKLILKNIDFTSEETKNNINESDSVRYDFFEAFTQFEGIDKILLQNARIIYRKKSGEFLVLAEDLNGWLRKEKNAKIMVNTTGSILYGKDNFSLYCDIDLIQETISGRVELANYQIEKTKFLINQNNITTNNGILDGRLYITSNTFDFDSLLLNGYINIFKFNFEILQNSISDFNAKIVIDNNKFTLKNASGFYNDSPVTIVGKIENIFLPEILGEISSETFKLSSIESFTGINEFNGSNLKFKSNFRVTPNDTIVNITINSPEIIYNKETFENLSALINYHNGQFSVNKINLSYLGYEINSKGYINNQNGKYEFTMMGSRHFDKHIFFDKLSNTEQCIDIYLNGNMVYKEMEGIWSYQIVGHPDTLIDINGNINLKDNLFNFAMNRSYNQEFMFSIQIANIFDNPEINFGYIENLPLHKLTSRTWLKDIAKKYAFEGILVGHFNKLNTELKFYSRSKPESAFILSGNLENLLKTEKNISGQWQYEKFAGIAEFQMGEDYLIGELKSNGSITGKIDLNLNREDQLSANLKLLDLDFNQFFSDTTVSGYGEITGEVNVNGNLDAPKVAANIKGNKFVINDIGYYKFDTHIHSSNSTVKIDTLNIALNNFPVLSGKATIDLNTKYIKAIAKGSEIEADYVLKTLLNDSHIISGIVDYGIEVNGQYTAPSISARLNFKNGIIGDIDYNEFKIELRDSIPENTNYLDYKNHLINIQKFTLIKNGQFHLEGNGIFPLYTNGKIDLHLNFDGDILSLLPNFSDFFIDGASFSTITLDIGGTPDKPKIQEGEIYIERGELWLEDVANHIDQLSGKIFIAKGSNKVNIEDLIISIDGNGLKMNTIHDVTTSSGHKLESWYFNDLDLDFGVLVLETPPKGIELNIPSLMVEGESGFLSLTGKTESEKFYFAGPVKHPTARGTITLSNSRISYPFPSSKSKDKDSAEEFLENMYWDVMVYPGKDLKYEREISAFLGEVNTELFVNPESKGIEFTGIINNNTFMVIGALDSDRGRLEYLDLNFRVEDFGVEFSQTDQKPRVYGRAWTVVRDSIEAIPRTIYLELYAVDTETGQEIHSSRWEDFRFRLVSADPMIGETQQQVLAYLGYSVENIENKATDVGGAVTENYLIRPILRPIERSLERYLGFDLVRFNSKIAKNLFQAGLGQTNGLDRQKSAVYNYNTNLPYLFLFESSEITVGKYISSDVYLTYTGQLVATALNQENDYTFNHSFGLEYRFFKNILLEFEYDREILNYYNNYTNKAYLEDFKIKLRHSFSF